MGSKEQPCLPAMFLALHLTQDDTDALFVGELAQSLWRVAVKTFGFI